MFLLPSLSHTHTHTHTHIPSPPIPVCVCVCVCVCACVYPLQQRAVCWPRCGLYHRNRRPSEGRSPGEPVIDTTGITYTPNQARLYKEYIYVYVCVCTHTHTPHIFICIFSERILVLPGYQHGVGRQLPR